MPRYNNNSIMATNQAVELLEDLFDCRVLALATNQELLEELEVRMNVLQHTVLGRSLGIKCREALQEFNNQLLGYRAISAEEGS